MRTQTIVFLTSVTLLVCCRASELTGAGFQESSGVAAVVASATQTQLLKLLPDPAKLGATKAGAPRFYGTDLYEYIDGEAVGFQAYDFVALLNQAYQLQDANVTVDIYDMGEPLNAFGVYASESSSDRHFVPIGTGGYTDDGVLHFWQDRYYVKLSGSSSKGTVDVILESLAQAVSQRIGGQKSLPAALALFPTDHLVAHSQKYLKASPLGYDFLAPAFKATYAWDGKESTVVISQAKDAKDAWGRIEELRSHFAKYGKVGPLTGLGFEAWEGTSPYEGTAIFFTRGAHTAILMSPPANPASFLKTLRAGLPE